MTGSPSPSPVAGLTPPSLDHPRYEHPRLERFPMGKGAHVAGPSGRGRTTVAHLLIHFRSSTLRLLMRRPRSVRRRFLTLISSFVLAPLLAGCGSQATE